ncbi:MAG: family 43 glycosylhydrolase [Acidimicrobiia bacterium]|nr:family 43 glycosylhydrolase [Acidimicrobiia bacterium]
MHSNPPEAVVAFELEDRWIWDFWITEVGGTYHLFFLQAPRSLGDADLRHDNAAIGHATSSDLVTWTDLGTVLEAGYPGEWDDIATWTGSVIEHQGRWWMFYTGRSTLEKGRVQRIGAAVSNDLNFWVKHPSNPLLSSHPFWYAHGDKRSRSTVAWRDPWVYPVEDGFEMLITARVNEGPAADRGVIGKAFSSDLSLWTALPPLTKPGGFGQMEVPQLVPLRSRQLVIFSCARSALAPSRAKADTPSDCYVLEVGGGGAPYPATEATFLKTPNLYGVRAVRGPDEWVVLGFEQRNDSGKFPGRITDPIPLDAVLPANLRAALR